MEAGEIRIAVDDLEVKEVVLTAREIVIKHSDGETARIYRFNTGDTIPAGARILSATLRLPAQLLGGLE